MFLKYTFRISHYATTSDEESVYIMGGYVGSSSQIIAQYKDGEWFKLENLAQRKHSFNAITFTHFSDSITMIVGGFAESG